MAQNGQPSPPEELRRLLAQRSPTRDEVYQALRRSFGSALPTLEERQAAAGDYARNEGKHLAEGASVQDVALHAVAVAHTNLMFESLLEVLADYLQPLFDERRQGETSSS
jgi:hypothetical protein